MALVPDVCSVRNKGSQLQIRQLEAERAELQRRCAKLQADKERLLGMVSRLELEKHHLETTSSIRGLRGIARTPETVGSSNGCAVTLQPVPDVEVHLVSLIAVMQHASRTDIHCGREISCAAQEVHRCTHRLARHAKRAGLAGEHARPFIKSAWIR
jgi:hypothetical protein